MNESVRNLSPPEFRALAAPSIKSAAVAVIAVALLGMIGALAPSSGLNQPMRSLPPATFVGMMGCLGIGVGLLGRTEGRRWLTYSGAGFTALVGLASLVMRSATEDAGGLLHLGKLPATTALLLSLGGLGLLALASRRRRRLGHALAGILGSTSLLLSLTVVLGRVFGLLGGSETGLLMGASPYSLLACAINGAALMRLASLPQPTTWPMVRWLPNAIGISAAVSVIFVWRALLDREREQMQRQIDLASVLASASVRAELLRTMNGIERLAIRVAVRNPALDAALIEQMQLLVNDDTQPILAAAWPRSDPGQDRSAVIVVPADSGFDTALTDVVQREIARPVTPGEPGDPRRPLDFYTVPGDREVYALGVRDCAAGPCRSPFAVLFDARRAFRTLLADSLTGFYLAVQLDSQRVIRPSNNGPVDETWFRSTAIDLPAGGSHWRISVWPTPATLARAQSDLPGGVLILGLVLATLLPVTLRLAENSWSTAARAERARVNAALESATDSLWVWDIPKDTIERGSALWTRLGYPVPPAAIPLGKWLELIHPKERATIRQAMSLHLSGATESVELEYRVRDVDDRWHWLVERGRVVERSDTGLPLRALGVTADITDRKNADAALAASESKYRATFDSASQMKALLDDRGRVVEMNPAGKALCDNPADAVGHFIWEYPAFHGSQVVRQKLMEACERGYAGTGTSFAVQLETEQVDSHTWDLSVTPIASSDSTITQLLVNGRDITDRKRAEQALRELGNLATMGRLTALVAHEINNPLAGIHSAFSLIKHAVPDTHPHFKYVGAIEREISRIAQVTRQLYETYRHEPEASRGASVETVVSDAVAFLEQVNRRSSVKVMVDMAAASTVVPFPDALIRRVVYNLVQNAVDASPEGGTVHLTASNGDSVFTLTVRDEGSGIPAEVRGRIFDPFVSTKGPGMRTGGMGLGLALVHGSVTAFGGTVSVHDAPGGGSIFTVRLPLTHTMDGVPPHGTWSHTAG